MGSDDDDEQQGRVNCTVIVVRCGSRGQTTLPNSILLQGSPDDEHAITVRARAQLGYALHAFQTLQIASFGEHDVHFQPVANLHYPHAHGQGWKQNIYTRERHSHAEYCTKQACEEARETYLDMALRCACERIDDNGKNIGEREMRRVWRTRRRGLVLKVYLRERGK